jgi:HAD superfamily hydrolase (TIGR01509 family)
VTEPNSPSSLPGRRLAGVIFDMDGVLVESEPFIAEAAVRMFAEKGVAVRHEEFRPFIGTGEDRFLGGVAEARGVALDMPRDKVRTYEIYLDLIRGRLQPLPGVREFIGRCRAIGWKMAVASSADRMKVEGNLRELGLPAGSFEVVVVGEDVARKKPAPDIFLEAARRQGLDPTTCLVIEDAESGVAAAKAAGCHCLGLTTSFSAQQLRTAGADWTAPDLASAPDDVLGSLREATVRYDPELGDRRLWDLWLAEVNRALAACPEAGARLWLYSTTHGTFQLVVGDPVGRNIAIMMFWCDWLSGPTSWSPQSLRATCFPRDPGPPHERRFVLEDPAGGFRAEAQSFHWARDVNVTDPYAWLIWRPHDDHR